MAPVSIACVGGFKIHRCFDALCCSYIVELFTISCEICDYYGEMLLQSRSRSAWRVFCQRRCTGQDVWYVDRHTGRQHDLPCQSNNMHFSIISQKRCKIGGKLVLITNRKSYMSFRLVPKSVTLNGVMAVTLHYFTEFGKPALQKTICGGIYARVYFIFSACTLS